MVEGINGAQNSLVIEQTTSLEVLSDCFLYGCGLYVVSTDEE